MKIVFITKQGWLILLAACVFIIGNCVLLYRFINKTSGSIAEDARVRALSDRYLANVNSGRLANIAAAVRELQKRPANSKTKILNTSDNDSDAALPKDEIKESLALASQHENPKESLDSVAKPVEQTSDQNQRIMSSKKDEVLTSTAAANDFVAAVLVIACNRPTVKRCLDLLLKYRPSARQFPIIVSQDCGHQETADVIATYGTQVMHIQQPDLSEVQGVPSNMQSMMGYYKISRHYKWALGQAFDILGYDTVIIVEDDLDVGKYFIFTYRKIPIISPGLVLNFVQKAFLPAGLIFGGAYFRKDLLSEGIFCFKMGLACQ